MFPHIRKVIFQNLYKSNWSKGIPSVSIFLFFELTLQFSFSDDGELLCSSLTCVFVDFGVSGFVTLEDARELAADSLDFGTGAGRLSLDRVLLVELFDDVESSNRKQTRIVFIGYESLTM